MCTSDSSDIYFMIYFIKDTPSRCSTWVGIEQGLGVGLGLTLGLMLRILQVSGINTGRTSPAGMHQTMKELTCSSSHGRAESTSISMGMWLD